MRQFFSTINNATIISCNCRTSQKGNDYLQIKVKDNFRNEFSFVDYNVGHESLYAPNTIGELQIKYSESQYGSTTYKNLEIDDFKPNN